MKEPPRLIQSLADRQHELGLNNIEFAARLGISRQLWEMTKTGKRNVGVTLLGGIVRAFPELNDQVLAYLEMRATRTDRRPKTEDGRPETIRLSDCL